jgi:hypothetical protein
LPSGVKMTAVTVTATGLLVTLHADSLVLTN